MNCWRIVFDTPLGSNVITACRLLPPGMYEHQTGRSWPLMHELPDGLHDIWMRNQPLPLAERVLYLLAEYKWPPEAIVALADHVYLRLHVSKESA